MDTKLSLRPWMPVAPSVYTGPGYTCRYGPGQFVGLSVGDAPLGPGGVIRQSYA